MNIEPSKDDRELANRILATLHNSNEMDHVAAAKVIAEWNTRPQPAPPEGEPDFVAIAFEVIEECNKHIARNGFSHDEVRVHESAAPAIQDLLEDRLGLASRPKVEDAGDRGRMAHMNEFTIQLEFEQRTDGRYFVRSANVPGLHLAGMDIQALCDDVEATVKHLLKHNLKIDAHEVRWIPTLDEVRRQFQHPAVGDGTATYVVRYKAA